MKIGPTNGFNPRQPPSDINTHLGKLLEEGEGFDVSFDVGGEAFEEHRFFLAMRSPVFKA